MSGNARTLSTIRRLLDTLLDRGPLTRPELAEVTGIARSSVYWSIDSCLAIDLVRSLPDGSIALSQRWLRLADAARAGLSEWSALRSVLPGLVERTGSTAYLAIEDVGQAICIDWAQGRGIEVLLLKPGRTMPFNAGAAGRGVLAHTDARIAQDYFEAGNFKTFTPRTIHTVDELRADVELTRSRGFVLSDEDVTVGIAAVGVPVHDSEGRSRGVLLVSDQVDEVHRRCEEYVAELRRAAAGQLL